jgi:hypothetical protein
MMSSLMTKSKAEVDGAVARSETTGTSRVRQKARRATDDRPAQCCDVVFKVFVYLSPGRMVGTTARSNL